MSILFHNKGQIVQLSNDTISYVMEVVDGKVVISSEELAAAIQTQQIDLGAEEEANIDINIRGVHC